MTQSMCLLLVLFKLCFTVMTVQAQDTVRVALGEWPPFTSQKQSDSLVEQVVTEAFAKNDIAVVIDYFPWKRSYELVKLGQYDLTYPWYRNDQREQDMLFNKEWVLEANEVFVIRKNSEFDWQRTADLQRYRIAGTRGYLHVDVLRKAGIAVDLGQSDVMNLKKLFARRVDAMPISDVVANRLIYQQYGRRGKDLFRVHGKPLMSDKLYALFNKDNPRSPYWIKKLDAGIRALKASGRYDAIINQLPK